MADQYARYRHLCGTAGEWAASDIIIGEGEIAVELPSTAGGKPRAKAGDGTRRYSQLQYIDGMDQAALNALLANYILKADGVTLAKLNADLTAERTRAEGAYVNIGGDRMTGQLELPGGGTGNQAATVSQLTTAIATTGTTTGGTGKNGQLIRTDVRGMIDLSLVSIPGGLRILGARDPSTAAPTSPDIGDAYIVDRDTTAHASYGPGVTGTLNSGDMLIYVGGVGGWDSLAAHADLNAYVKRVGDTMTGPLVLSGAPTADLHAATKKYTDDTFVNVTGDIMTGTLIVEAAVITKSTDGYVLFGTANGENPFDPNYSRFEIRVDPAANVIRLGNTISGTGAPKDLIFMVGSANHLTLKASKNIIFGPSGEYPGVGNGNVGGMYENTGACFFSTQSVPALGLNRNTPGGILAFRLAGAQISEIVVSGTGVNYPSASDYRLKENVLPMVGALAKVASLNPVTYTWKVDGSAGQGFIAHELAQQFPEAVTGEKDAVDEDGSIKHQGIDTSFLVATLAAAIQEQQALITDLQTRLDALESRP